MDIRCYDDDIAKVCSPRSGEELEQTQGWAMGHMASAMLEKYFDSRPSNTHMASVLNPIHTRFAPWTLHLWKERSPLQQAHWGLLGHITQWVRSEPGSLGEAFVSFTKDRFLSFVTRVHIQRLAAWALFWQPPCRKLLTFCLSSFRSEEQKVGSVLRRWKLNIHLFIYCDLFRTTCYRMPCFIYRCFWKDLLK